MKRKMIAIILVIMASVALATLYENITLEHVIGVQPLTSDSMIILQKDAKDTLLSSVVSGLKSDYQLIRVDGQGKILQTYALPKDDRNTFSDYDNLTVDGQSIYVHRMVKNPDNYFIFAEQVIRIARDTGKIDILFNTAYEDGYTVEYALITKMYLEDQQIVFIATDENDSNVIHISNINLLTNSIFESATLNVDPDLNLVGMLYMPSNDVIINTADGKLFLYRDEQMTQLTYEGMPETVRPEKLMIRGLDEVTFYDHLSEDLCMINLTTETFSVLRSGITAVDEAKGLFYADAFGISVSTNDAIVGSFRLNSEMSRYVFMDDQRVITLLDDIDYSFEHGFIVWLVVLIILALFSALILLLVKLYRRSGGSLIIKFILILLPLVLIIPLISLSMSLTYFMNLVQNDLYAELFYIASERVEKIDENALESIQSISDYDSASTYVVDLQRQISANYYNDLVEDTYDRWYYSVVYRVMDDDIYTVLGDDVDFWIDTRHIYGELGNEPYLEAVSNGRTALGVNSDTTGVWVFAVAPIMNAHGDVIGLYEVGTGEESYIYFILSYYGKLVFIVIGIVAVVLTLMGYIIFRIIKPLRNLNDSAGHIAAGEWGTTVPFNTMDEVGHLANTFNRMSLFIKDYINELTALNKIYYKFIPMRYFEMLKKEKISEVQNGDYSYQEMVIMHLNAANYFEITSGLDAEAQLDLLNRLFEVYAAAIHAQNGLVGEFRNSGLIAVYMSESEAFNAAATIMQRIHAGFKQVKTTIVLHKGGVLLGIVGDEHRMNTTVISEAVNDVTGLSSVASTYQTGVVVTSSMIMDSQSKLRYIGVAKGITAQKEMALFEWLDSLPIQRQGAFYQTKAAFDRAMQAYEHDDFENAKKGFVEVIKGNSHDLIAKAYLYKCEQLMEQAVDHEPLFTTN